MPQCSRELIQRSALFEGGALEQNELEGLGEAVDSAVQPHVVLLPVNGILLSFFLKF